MSRLLLIRHGQATIDGGDYDRLSELGRRQARILGAHWARLGLELDRVYTGPLRRQRDTAEETRRAFVEGGGSWPESEELEAFREHSGPEVMAAAMEELAESDPQLSDLMSAMTGDAHRDVKAYFRIFRYVMRLWIREDLELAAAGLEPWRAFRARVDEGLAEVARATDRDQTAAVFTSGGPVGVATATLLGLDHEKALELTWVVQNSAVTEFTGRRNGLALKTFNSASHLPSAELVTLV